MMSEQRRQVNAHQRRENISVRNSLLGKHEHQSIAASCQHVERISVQKCDQRVLSCEFDQNSRCQNVKKFHDETDTREDFLFNAAGAHFQHEGFAVQWKTDFVGEAENHS